MAARNDNVVLAAGAWTQVTDGDVSAIRVQNIGTGAVWLKARVGTGAIATLGGAICLDPLMTLGADTTLAELFPGVSGGNRVYAWSEGGGLVSVSHA